MKTLLVSFFTLISFFVGQFEPFGALGQTLRIVAYNIQDKPVTADDDLDIRAIIDAIGQFQLSGVSRNIDLMAFQEGPESAASYVRLENDFEIEFGGNFRAIRATADPNGDRTGFVFDTGSLQLISSSSIDNMGFTHKPLLATFRPVGGQPADEFSVLTLHLKAGTGSSNANRRALEAIRIGDIVDSLPAGRPVIFLGDFNMKGSHEDAWPNLVAAGALDTINLPIGLRIAKWNNSIAFHPHHTQDTTGLNGGMDDRFDLMLVTSEFMDHRGIEFNPGSISTLGNNGTHMLDSGIFTGTGALSVQANLIALSDHLPIFADFDWGVVRSTPDVMMADEAVSNYTIRQSGPVTGSNGSSLFQVEGTSNGNFASFGVVDFDVSGVLSSGLVASRIEDIDLGLRQVNESFTRDGPISIYVASPSASSLPIDSGIRFQTGNNKLDCVPADLANGAELAAFFPGIHHSPTGSELPDGTIDLVVLNHDAIRTAMLNALNTGGTFRLILVPDHENTTATYAGNTNALYTGPTVSGLYDTSNAHRTKRKNGMSLRRR